MEDAGDALDFVLRVAEVARHGEEPLRDGARVFVGAPPGERPEHGGIDLLDDERAEERVAPSLASEIEHEREGIAAWRDGPRSRRGEQLERRPPCGGESRG